MFYNEAMPFSYDIEPDDASRRRRRASRDDGNNAQRMSVKALGPNISSLARGAAVYDPNAEDGDGDGLVQDSTPFERPALFSALAATARGLRSASDTGYLGQYTSRGSWTVGLSNREVAERVVPDNAGDFVKAMHDIAGNTGGLTEQDRQYMDRLLIQDIDFSPENVAQLRNLVETTLNNRPALRAAWDRLGAPPMGVATIDGFAAAGKTYGTSGILFHPHYAFQSQGKHQTDRRITAAVWGRGPLSLGGKLDTASIDYNDIGDLVSHEWGHYLNFLVEKIAPTQELRDFALSFLANDWEPFVKGMKALGLATPDFDTHYTNEGVQKTPGMKYPDLPPNDVPFVSSMYAQTSPVEFFAEAVSGYFSPVQETREMVNPAATRLVEVMLGVRDVRSGLSSRSGSPLPDTTASSMRGKTPAEIARMVVPGSFDEARALSRAHNRMLKDTATGKPYTDAYDGDLDGIFDRRRTDMFLPRQEMFDFSEDAVETLRNYVTKTLSDNPDFYRMVQQYGMPPVMFSTIESPLRGNSFAISAVEGFPGIFFDRESWLEAQAFGIGNEMDDTGFLDGTEMFLIDPSINGFLIHEWAHFFNRLATDVHPDEEMRALALFWISEQWDNDSALPRRLKLFRKLGFSSGDRVMDRVMGGGPFAKRVAKRGKEEWSGFPHVLGQYGQSQPSEAFAEAVVAILSQGIDDRGLVSPEMRRDVIDILGLSPTTGSINIAPPRSEGTTGFASRTVKRDAGGVRLIPTGGDRSHPTPYDGPDWMKDMTDDEIVDAVVALNVEDYIAATMMNVAMGNDVSANPMSMAGVVALMRTTMFGAPVLDANGQQVVDPSNGRPLYANVPVDFSPEGIDYCRRMIRRMLAESPEFAWMVRRFGCPPIMVLDEEKLKEINDDVAAAGWQLPYHLHSTGVGGFSVGPFGVTMRRDPNDDDAPMGWNRAISRKKRTGRIVMNPDGTSEEEVERWMNNMGLSAADKGIHEWAHWFYDMIRGVGKRYGIAPGSEPADRRQRLSYFFPNIPYEEAEALTKEFLDAFDAEGFIPPSDMGVQFFDRVYTAATRKIMKHYRNNPAAAQSASLRFFQLYNEWMNQVIMANKYSPEIQREYIERFRAEFPFLLNDFPYLLAGTYAMASRQELWAETVLLFSSPDRKLKSKFLHKTAESFVARIMGLKKDKNPDIPYDKPWKVNPFMGDTPGGFASRSGSRVQRLHAAEDSLIERVSGTTDGFVSSPVGTIKTPKISSVRTTGSTSRFRIGDYEFVARDEDLSTYDWNSAYDQWTTWSGGQMMREMSASMMGIDVQREQGLFDTSSSMDEVIRSGKIAQTGETTKDEIMESLLNTYSAMDSVFSGDYRNDSPLYRGLGSVGDDSPILMAKQGELISMPLTSFSSDYSYVRQMTDLSAEEVIPDQKAKKVILRLNSGANVAHSDYLSESRMDDGTHRRMPIESITQGEFRVVSSRDENGYTVINLSQEKVFDPYVGRMSPVDRSESGLASRVIPPQNVSTSAARTLRDNMEYLRDNPARGRRGEILDDLWAEETIKKLESNTLEQDDVMNLLHATMDLINKELDENPELAKEPVGRLLAYQKLAKRLRKALVPRKENPRLDEDDDESIGLASRSLSRRVSKTVDIMGATGKPRTPPSTTDEFVARAVPRSPEQVRALLKDSPYSSGKGVRRTMKKLEKMGIDWEKQALLEQRVRRLLDNNPEFARFLAEHDIPPMFVTKQNISGGGTDLAFLSEPESWFGTQGQYHPGMGILAFPEHIATGEQAYMVSNMNAEEILVHELSHTIHAMSVQTRENAKDALVKDWTLSLTGGKEMSQYDIDNAALISKYATRNRAEYIAETMRELFYPSGRVDLRDAHYEMLSEFLGIPPERLKGMAKTVKPTRQSGLRSSSGRMEQTKSSFSIGELLSDAALADELKRRDELVRAMSVSERNARYTDDDGYIYVLHWGASTLQGGALDPARSRGQVGAGIAGNTRQVNDETARFMVRKRDAAKRDISILEDMKLQAERDGVIDFDALRSSDPSDSLRAGRARLLLGIDRRDGDVQTVTADSYMIGEIDSKIGSEKRVIDRLDKVADQLIADDYQYSSTYRASQLQELFGSHGGRYAEDDSADWGDEQSKSPLAGIHVFRVKVGDDAVEENSVGETHLVGKHTPIASLVVDNDPETKNPARNTWAGWVDMVIERDKESRRGGLASRIKIHEPVENIEEARNTGRPWLPLTDGNIPPTTQKMLTDYENRPADVFGIPDIADSIDEFVSMGLTKEDAEVVVRGLVGRSAAKVMARRRVDRGMEDQLMTASESVKKDSPIFIALPLSALGQVLRDRRLKNQFETGTSRGALNTPMREENDVAHFGLIPGTSPEHRPIYGHIPEAFTPGRISQDILRGVSMYGDIHFVLKKDTNNRTTYSVGDSLGEGIIPTPMGKPTIESVEGTGASYIEAQIHGGVSIDDVGMVVLRQMPDSQVRDMPNVMSQIGRLNPKAIEEIKAMLDDLGIPVLVLKDGENGVIDESGNIVNEASTGGNR